MRIALIANQRDPGSSAEIQREYASEETLSLIAGALIKGGADVELFEAVNGLKESLYSFRTDGHLAFNIAEGEEGPGRKSQVPLILNELGMPHTHSGIGAQSIAQNKAQTRNHLFRTVMQPRWQAYSSVHDIDNIRSDFSYPLIAKPLGGGCSIGIDDDCVVYGETELRRVVKRMIDEYGPAIVEEFLGGPECNMAVVGDIVYPPLEWDFKDMDGSPKVKTWGLKQVASEYASPIMDSEEALALAKNTIRVLQELGAVDAIRVDYRRSKRSGPHALLEANLLPALSKNSSVAKAASLAGVDYDTVIQSIVYSAIERAKGSARYCDVFDEVDIDGFRAPYENVLESAKNTPISAGAQLYNMLMPKRSEIIRLTRTQPDEAVIGAA